MTKTVPTSDCASVYVKVALKSVLLNNCLLSGSKIKLVNAGAESKKVR